MRADLIEPLEAKKDLVIDEADYDRVSVPLLNVRKSRMSYE